MWYRNRSVALSVALLFSFLPSGCDLLSSSDAGPEPTVRTERETFESGSGEWSGGFSDYSEDMDRELMALTFEVRDLPEGVDSTGQALFLSGRNISDDLFMFAKKPLTGLTPDAEYEVSVDVSLASNAPSGCVGIGGPPGEAVTLKAGASAVEPKAELEDGSYRMNVDKGNQSTGGENAAVIGDVANSIQECHETPYAMISRSTEEPVRATTSSDGTLWVFVGTDSGFEGSTALYYEEIRIHLEPVEE